MSEGRRSTDPRAADPIRVDLSALRTPPGMRTLLAYERAARIPLHRRFFAVLAGVLLLTAAIVAALWWLGSIGMLARVPLLAVFGVFYGVMGAAGFVWYAVGLSRRARLAMFAGANGWAYADLLQGTRRPGSAFTRMRRSVERGVVASEDPRIPFELGLARSVGGRDEAATVQRPFAFIELPLPAKVPHIVLRNRRRSIVPTLGLGGARMDLEGHFASTFQLLVPEGYQRDALYIFTPDLMARVLDLGAGAELELVEDRAYVYLPGSTRFDRPDVMQGTVQLAEELHRRFAARTGPYRDENTGPIARPEGVAIGLGGQRLGGQGVSLLAVAGVSAAVILSAGITAFALFGGAILRSGG
ncbi:MAG: DUF2157 domain-containing protein [Microbacterium sp.]|uniref:hypothetical protein n=1 Tax=Microbacterium sp. TaxID=51671 RepID=UPI002823100B|nr:hypothetical protein [Microbacterium sp.]MDR2320732.1 DUF2157 domain-containing protein [Microbacterium sp.]